MGAFWVTAFATLTTPMILWLGQVIKAVREPYLDEVFHVRQAQHYCNGDFQIWDPKITTPPGLYSLSYLVAPILGCSISSLRAINAVCLSALLAVVYLSYESRRQMRGESGQMSKVVALHSSLNAVLFPPLFFFSALYYTDVASTLSVMVYLNNYISFFQTERRGLGHAVLLVALGLISLTFRQTNIFWVAVAPAGWLLVARLDQGHQVVKQSMYRRSQGFGDSTFNIIKTCWKYETIYDPPVQGVWIEDYVCTALSIAACAFKAATQPRRILRLTKDLSPFLAIIAAFAAFIIWNGGVVLGDKSNHVATVNLPQMLYFWPFIAFFSWPLLLPYLLLIPLTIASRIGVLPMEPLLFFKRRDFLPRSSLMAGLTLLACAIVHFNTLVHPFMLADNRHYVFYVFKRLLRPWWIRYAVTPIYALCAWVCIDICGGPPCVIADGQARASKPDGNAPVTSQESTESTPSADYGGANALNFPDGRSSAPICFVLVFLATAALQLCTAPLVEPRYFIVPWMVWRIHLPLRTSESRQGRKQVTLAGTLNDYDYRLILETVWFLVINAVTGYIFLNRTFMWLSEPTAAMRFMW